MAPKRRTPSPRKPKAAPQSALVRVLREEERPLFYGGADPITLNRLEGLVNNIRTMRAEDLNRRRGELDPRRSLNDECGYPDWVDLQDLKDLIDREPCAGLVNSIFPLESWKVQCQIWEDDDEDVVTPFEEDLADLPRQLAVEPSYYQEEKGNALLEFFLHADVMMGYGRYGIALIGVNDGKELSEPVTPSQKNEITFLQAFPEHLATIQAFETDRKQKRYGWPTQYNVTFSDPDSQSTNGMTESMTTEAVHWSRIVHLTDRWHHPATSRVFAVERLRPVLNPLLDIRKVRGASAEMYYKGAFFGLHFGTHPQLGPDVDVDKNSLLDMYEEYVNGLQRALFTSGMTVDPLAPQVVGPKEQIDVQLEAISIKTRIPKRKLMGSERGELSSADDRKDFNGTLASRQQMHNTPRVIVPVIDRLINLGILRAPAKEAGYKCWWPDMVSESAKERADALLVRTQAYTAYVQGMAEIVQPEDYMTKFDSVPKDEAEEMLKNTEEAQEEAAEEAQAMADEHGLVPDPADPTGQTLRDPPVDPIELEKEKAKARQLSLNRLVEDEEMYLVDGLLLVDNAKGGKGKLSGGVWRTVNGTPVYIKAGVVVAGPKALKGKTEKEAEGHGAVGHDKGDKVVHDGKLHTVVDAPGPHTGGYAKIKDAEGKFHHVHQAELKHAGEEHHAHETPPKKESKPDKGAEKPKQDHQPAKSDSHSPKSKDEVKKEVEKGGLVDTDKVFDHKTVHMADLPKKVVQAGQKLEGGQAGVAAKVNLKDLIPTQDYVGADKIKGLVKEFKESSANLHVVDYKGKLYIYDGHHTAVAGLAAGHETLPARIIKVD